MKNLKIIILMLLTILLITGCFNKSNDALKFKEEYEVLNGNVIENSDKIIRTITIDKNNPFIYKTAEDIVKSMENNESFLVYFGFATCPWCRSVVSTLTKSAKDLELDKIYYVDVLKIRSKLSMDESGNIKTEKEGTKDYYKLLELMDSVLSDYTSTDLNGNKVSMGEKRIYAPNVVSVVEGKAVKMETGISDKLTDPYMKLTEEIEKDTYKMFKSLIKIVKNDTTCELDEKC